MIHYRPFLNSDPPAIADIWRSQAPSNAWIQPVTPAVLDHLVYSKPYFDRQGMILAIEDDKPIGFVHAGFGPNESHTALDTTQGTTALLMVVPHSERDAIAQELLRQSEHYLRQRGAKALYGGATDLLAPFYLGLYGGSRCAGVLASDVVTATIFRQAEYAESSYARIFRRDLVSFRPVDRELMQLRRQYQLVKQTDELPRNWWEACEFAGIERVSFALLPKGQGPPVAEALFWDIEPLASSWGMRCMGQVSMQVTAESNRCAVATHFWGEIFRQLQGFGIAMVEIQLQSDDEWAVPACDKLGMKQYDQGLLFQKPTIAKSATS